MKSLLFISFFLFGAAVIVKAQEITYSEVEKADYRNLNFEILGNFSGDFLIYKNLNKRQELTIYDNNMTIKKSIDLDFISDKTFNIDFITYPDYFIMIWQYEKGNVTYCKGAKMSGTGQLIGNVTDMDTTKTGFFANKVYYDLAVSENKKQILVYKSQSRNDEYDLTTKLYDENLRMQDSTRNNIPYNDRREAFGDLQVSNEGTFVFSKVKQNARPEYINTLDVNFRRRKADGIITVNVPLDDQLIQDPNIKIDNISGRYLINSFSYKRNDGNINGLFTALIGNDSLHFLQKAINIFDDSLRSKLSGRPDLRTAYNDFYLRSIVLKKDGGFIASSEEYYKQRRFNSGFDDRYNSGIGNYRYYSSPTDYYLYNRGYYGYYRPFNDSYARDVIYNYNDIVIFSLSKDLKLQWNNVINKTTSDAENDNFLSFANMNAGAEIHFLFLQNDNNRQIISDHALQPDGSIIRYATLKGREAGYFFMPKLGRQTGLHQMIIPCIVRNNVAFAKIDF